MAVPLNTVAFGEKDRPKGATTCADAQIARASVEVHPQGDFSCRIKEEAGGPMHRDKFVVRTRRST